MYVCMYVDKRLQSGNDLDFPADRSFPSILYLFISLLITFPSNTCLASVVREREIYTHSMIFAKRLRSIRARFGVRLIDKVGLPLALRSDNMAGKRIVRQDSKELRVDSICCLPWFFLFPWQWGVPCWIEEWLVVQYPDESIGAPSDIHQICTQNM